MADVNIGSDQLLATTLNENDRLIFTRAETGQQIASISLADFKKTISYAGENLLTEQKVIGEFWNGKQVYIRTFAGNMPNLDESNQTGKFVYLTDFLCDEVQIVRGVIGRKTAKSSKTYGDSSLNTTYYWDIIILENPSAGNKGKILLDASYSSFRNTPFCVTIKYTKA